MNRHQFEALQRSREWFHALRLPDYFSWRRSDPARCALNGWCDWTLRSAGESAAAVTRRLERTSAADKNELLFQHGINFNDVPLSQRRGIGVMWETYLKDGFNPVTEQAVQAVHRRGDADQGSCTSAARSDRCCRELSRWSSSNGGNWISSRTWGGTADQSYVSVTLVCDGPAASRS